MDQPQPPTPVAFSGQHVKELDGVRALAIWLVLIGHLFDTSVQPGGVFSHAPALVRFVIHHGNYGVDLFFALSGFLITGILLRTKSLGTAKYFQRFYTRRALRILPLYFLVLAVIVIWQGRSTLPWLGLATLFSANLSPVFGIDVPDQGGPFWSLAVEEQFYLLWPWLVLWLPPRGLVVATLVILIVEPILRLANPNGDYFLTWFHSDGLAVGALLAVWFYHWNGDRRAVRNLILAFLATFVALTAAIYPFGGLGSGPIAAAVRNSQFYPLAGALIAAAIGFSGTRALAFLRSRPAVYTALLSYCIYVIHKPLMVLYERAAPRMAISSHLSLAQSTVAEGVFVIGTAYVVASFSWKYFEKPILRRGH